MLSHGQNFHSITAYARNMETIRAGRNDGDEMVVENLTFIKLNNKDTTALHHFFSV